MQNSHRSRTPKSRKFREALVIAEQNGLLTGARTHVLRGRMPEKLVARAKARTGLKSDTDLIEVALANLAVADDYADWLLSQYGTVDPNIDLEF
ncbi:MAG: hypothetical protein ACRD3Y_02870 [Bryobacteraceae bacterium]